MRSLSQILETAMAQLAKHRPVFHSEADFQLALAWELQNAHPAAQLRLEKRIADNPRIELDILLALDGRTCGLELKYPRARLAAEVGDERFSLSEGAPDVERYDSLKDISRLERLCDEDLLDAGCFVLLTNARGFWSPPAGPDPTAYDRFRLHEGSVLDGVCGWGATAGPGTRDGRADAIALRSSYALHWRDFSSVDGAAFRYLLVPVGQRP